MWCKKGLTMSKYNRSFDLTLGDIDLLEAALEKARFNQRMAADLLGLTYHQFRGKLRKFNIRGADLTPGDDFGMMKEVLTRRFKRLLKDDPERDKGLWPDLLLIDGGAGQVSAVAGIMARYGTPERPEHHAFASCIDYLTGYSGAQQAANHSPKLDLFVRAQACHLRRRDIPFRILAHKLQVNNANGARVNRIFQRRQDLARRFKIFKSKSD